MELTKENKKKKNSRKILITFLVHMRDKHKRERKKKAFFHMSRERKEKIRVNLQFNFINDAITTHSIEASLKSFL